MEVLDQLKEIGVDELHEKTHISIHSLKIILEQRFDAINTIQYRGFLSIIEGNLNINMDPLREAYDEYQKLHNDSVDEHEASTHIAPEESKSKLIFILVGALIFIGVMFYFLTGSSKESKKLQNNSAISEAKTHLKELNTSASTPVSQATKTSSSVSTFNPKQVKEPEEEHIVEQPFILYPKEKLWIGVINLKTGEKIDTITDKPFPLDENADLLISLGHGYLDIELYGEKEELTDSGRVRLLYKDGKLTHISASKFKELNKGQSW